MLLSSITIVWYLMSYVIRQRLFVFSTLYLCLNEALDGPNYRKHKATVKSFNFKGTKFFGLATLDMFVDT